MDFRAGPSSRGHQAAGTRRNNWERAAGAAPIPALEAPHTPEEVELHTDQVAETDTEAEKSSEAVRKRSEAVRVVESRVLLEEPVREDMVAEP